MYRSNVSRRFVVSRLAAASAAVATAPLFANGFAPEAKGGYSVLQRFGGKKRGDGATPSGGVILATDGFLYGLTSAGGRKDSGSLYRLKGAGTERVVLNFVGASGTAPVGELVQASDGAFYGTVQSGGENNSGGVFRADPAGSYELIYSFDPVGSGNLSGYSPAAGLCLGPNGLLYGVTPVGGSAGGGTAFQIDMAGNFALLRAFVPAEDGSSPLGALIYGSDGLLYGTTSSGGARKGGTVFSMQLGGSITWIYPFSGGKSANLPNKPGSGVTLIDGVLYGTTRAGGKVDRTSGAVYRIVPGTSDLVVLHAFAGDDGSKPDAPVTLGEDGLLYGTTSAGGSANKGTLFQLDTAGTMFKALHTFVGAKDSADPIGRLLAQGTQIFGVTAGNSNAGDGLGTVFVVDSSVAA